MSVYQQEIVNFRKLAAASFNLEINFGLSKREKGFKKNEFGVALYFLWTFEAIKNF